MKRSFLIFFFLLAVGLVYAQQFKVSGSVTDHKSGDPIIGASVVVQNTSNGVITDLDGNFVLDRVSKGDVLSVSYVGYKSQEIVMDGVKSNSA